MSGAEFPDLALYRTMRLIRRFEEVATHQLLAQRIPANLHTSIGQEAVAAGICGALRRLDVIYSTHRGHGHCIAKGIDPTAMMAELMGKANGTNKGRAGSMHVADASVGVLGTNGIVGGGVPLAVGAAYAAQIRRTGGIVVCFFGDGAAAEGSVHEAMNLAALWKLPVVFVCEHNVYAELTRCEIHTPIDYMSERAAGYGMPGFTIDGNDVAEVFRAAVQAAECARSDGGPTLLECRTFRMRGHFEGDPQRYKNMEEEAEWAKRDPIVLFQRELRRRGVSDSALTEIDTEIEEELTAAVQSAVDAALPDPSSLLDHVYAAA